MVLKLCCYQLKSSNQGFSEASDIPLHKKHRKKNTPPQDFFLVKHLYVRDLPKFTWMRPLKSKSWQLLRPFLCWRTPHLNAIIIISVQIGGLK